MQICVLRRLTWESQITLPAVSKRGRQGGYVHGGMHPSVSLELCLWVWPMLSYITAWDQPAQRFNAVTHSLFFFFFAFVSVASRSTKPNILLPAPIWENPSFLQIQSIATLAVWHPRFIFAPEHWLYTTLPHKPVPSASGSRVIPHDPRLRSRSRHHQDFLPPSLPPQKGCWHPLRCSSPSRGVF